MGKKLTSSYHFYKLLAACNCFIKILLISEQAICIHYQAMLVHPDKNIGNEKASEAFMKLQNAYEVSFDSSTHSANLKTEFFLGVTLVIMIFPGSNGFHETKGIR